MSVGAGGLQGVEISVGAAADCEPAKPISVENSF